MGHLLQNVDFRTRDDLGHYIVLLSGLDMILVTALCWRQDSTWFGLRHCVDVRTRHDLGYCFMLTSGLDMIWVTALCWCQDSTWFGLLHCVDVRTRHDLGYCFMLMSGLDMIWVTAFCWCQDSTWFGLLHYVDVRTRHHLDYCIMLMSGLDIIWITALCWFQGAGWFWLLHDLDFWDARRLGLLLYVDFRAQGDFGHCKMQTGFQDASQFGLRSLSHFVTISNSVVNGIKFPLWSQPAHCVKVDHRRHTHHSDVKCSWLVVLSWSSAELLDAELKWSPGRWRTDYDDDVHSDWSPQRQRGYII